MKSILSNFTKFQKILLIINMICYTICAFLSWSLDGWIAWASCVTFSIYLIYNAQSKYISFIWIIISYLIYIYFNIKEFYFGELALSIFSICINFVAMLNWKKHTQNNKLEINLLKFPEILITILATIALAIASYFILTILKSELIILNSLSIAFVLIEYYYTFRRTKLKFVAGIISVVVYILLWIIAMNSIRDYALMFVVNGFINIIWYVDGIVEWHKISNQNKQISANCH